MLTVTLVLTNHRLSLLCRAAQLAVFSGERAPKRAGTRFIPKKVEGPAIRSLSLAVEVFSSAEVERSIDTGGVYAQGRP
jgi:hypothetical protein